MTFEEVAAHYFMAADDMADAIEDDDFYSTERKAFAREAIKEALKQELVAVARGQWGYIREMAGTYSPPPLGFDEGHPFSDSDEVPY